MKPTLIALLALVVAAGCGKKEPDTQANPPEPTEATLTPGMKAKASHCKANLKTLDTVITTWMVDKKKRPGDEVTIEDLLEFFHDGKPPECPSGGEYTLTSAKGERCSCSIHSEEEEDEYEE